MMQFTLRYPMDRNGDPALLTPDQLARVARTTEDAGFSAIAFTEHPAPSTKWLDQGGHDSLDPLSALTFVAGVTSRIRLMTYLLVLPYRNPLLLAKQATTVDVLSAGRLTMAVGTGYLRSEFLALGVDFDERNDLFDEAIDVITGAWRTPDFRYEGRHFRALGQTQEPPPVQRPHPPLWIGGNSARARERAAQVAQGWTPLIQDRAKAKTTRTPALDSPAALERAITELRDLAEAAGRDVAALDVQVEWPAISDTTRAADAIVDDIGALVDAGATWAVYSPPGSDVAETLDAIRTYGSDVVSTFRPANAAPTG